MAPRTGCFQWLAKSSGFETVTLVVIGRRRFRGELRSQSYRASGLTMGLESKKNLRLQVSTRCGWHMTPTATARAPFWRLASYLQTSPIVSGRTSGLPDRRDCGSSCILAKVSSKSSRVLLRLLLHGVVCALYGLCGEVQRPAGRLVRLRQPLEGPMAPVRADFLQIS